MNKLRIAVIPGDGTGPEVTTEALKVLQAVAALEKFQYELEHFDYGGERYLKTGEVLPEGAVERLRTFDAILLGAVGHPDVPPGILEKGLLLELRFQLDQYINLRPVKLYPGVETPLVGEWRSPGLVVLDTRIYAIGGWSGRYLSLNQVYEALPFRLFIPGSQQN